MVFRDLLPLLAKVGDGMADDGYLVEDTVKCNECGSRNLNRAETRGEVV